MADILTEIRFWAMVGEIAKRTIFCSPENESRIKGYVDARSLAGTFTVKTTRYLPDDRVLVVDEAGIKAEMNSFLSKPIRIR